MSPRRSRSRDHDGRGGRGSARGREERGREERDGGSGFGGGVYLQMSQTYRGEDWQVRTVPGDSGKHYRCPGCDQEIPPGVGHVVAWPEHRGAEDRRHWHKACWAARDRRSAAVQRGRNAPRY